MIDDRCPGTAPVARLVVLGSAGLTEGFGLIGAETYPDATPAMVETSLEAITTRRMVALPRSATKTFPLPSHATAVGM